VGGTFQWRVSGGFPRHGLGEELGLRLGSLGDRPDENSFNAGSRPRERRETRGERRETRSERFEAPGW